MYYHSSSFVIIYVSGCCKMLFFLDFAFGKVEKVGRICIRRISSKIWWHFLPRDVQHHCSLVYIYIYPKAITMLYSFAFCGLSALGSHTHAIIKHSQVFFAVVNCERKVVKKYIKEVSAESQRKFVVIFFSTFFLKKVKWKWKKESLLQKKRKTQGRKIKKVG